MTELTETIIQKDTRTPMNTVVLFTIGKTQMQTRCSMTNEWIKKMWYKCVYTYIYMYTHTHTQWNTTKPQERMTQCHMQHMKGPRDDHTE